MKDFKLYYNTQEFALLSNVNTKTLQRFKKKFLTENPTSRKIIKVKGENMYSFDLLKEFVSNDIFQHLNTIQKLRNTVRCLKRVDSLEYKLFHKNWTWFGCIPYKFDFSDDACFDIMHKVYDKLEAKYGNETDLRMFFTTESFLIRDGSHNHFVFYVSNPELIPKIENDMKVMFDGNRIFLDEYDDVLAGIFYNGKKGLKGTDWDILGNNLAHEGMAS